jgi:hypothetical protein
MAGGDRGESDLCCGPGGDGVSDRDGPSSGAVLLIFAALLAAGALLLGYFYTGKFGAPADVIAVEPWAGGELRLVAYRGYRDGMDAYGVEWSGLQESMPITGYAHTPPLAFGREDGGLYLVVDHGPRCLNLWVFPDGPSGPERQKGFASRREAMAEAEKTPGRWLFGNRPNSGNAGAGAAERSSGRGTTGEEGSTTPPTAPATLPEGP